MAELVEPPMIDVAEFPAPDQTITIVTIPEPNHGRGLNEDAADDGGGCCSVGYDDDDGADAYCDAVDADRDCDDEFDDAGCDDDCDDQEDACVHVDGAAGGNADYDDERYGNQQSMCDGPYY